MECWYIGELSNMTGVSKRTLYHYDDIGLLKPESRGGNQYRLYLKKDLLKLKKIMLLKKFGFELGEIQNLLDNKPSDIVLNLKEHLKILQKK